MEVIEVTRPKRIHIRRDHPARGKTDEQMRLGAVEMAADMEQGYYIAADGAQWPPRPFVVVEVLERLGYDRANAAQGRRPTWWPGTNELRRMVSLKILLRTIQRTPSEGDAPWLDAALAASAEEVLRRLYVAPDKIAMRELTELTTKLARMKLERPKPEERSKKGTMVFEEIRRTILELPEGEQDRARADMERAIERARAALPERTSVEVVVP